MEPPLEPYVERYIFGSCAHCDKDILLHDELLGANLDILYPEGDIIECFPCCSESCREEANNYFKVSEDEQIF